MLFANNIDFFNSVELGAETTNDSFVDFSKLQIMYHIYLSQA